MAKSIQASELPTFLESLVRRVNQPRMRDTLGLWLDLLQSDLALGFLNSRSPEGKTWPALKRKRSPIPPHNPGRRPLIDFGNLLASVAGNGSGHVEDVQDDHAVMGTNLPYSQVHQTGTLKTDRIPARPFLGVPDTSADELAEMVADELVKQLDSL